MNSNMSFLTFCPSHFYMASGVGESKYRLVAFDNALISAGVSGYNLLKVSSILPSKCQRREKVEIKEGSLLPTAYASISSDCAGEQISACIAVGIPENEDDIGVIMEYSDSVSKELAEDTCRAMVAEAMNNHHISVKEILSTVASTEVGKGCFSSVVSVLSMW